MERFLATQTPSTFTNPINSWESGSYEFREERMESVVWEYTRD